MEFGITPFDEQLNISWPLGEFELSEKDKLAPSIHELISIGKLPQ
jgi:dTDP-4-dehydrorhamnose 3,5-epimerase-like enzyme